MNYTNLFLNVIVLFFVPVVSVYIHSVVIKNNVTSCWKYLFIYSIYTFFDAMVSRTVFNAVEVLFSVSADDIGSIHFIIAFVVSVMMPFIYEILKKNIEIKCTIKRKDEISEFKN